MQDKLTIKCPKCDEMFPLDETLAGPMIAQVRAEAEARINASRKEADEKSRAVEAQAQALGLKEKQLAEREASVHSTVNQEIAKERLAIAEAERENARKELQPQLEAERNKAADLQLQLSISQKEELALRLQKDELARREKMLDLEVLRKVDEHRNAIHEQASKDADEKSRLRLAEKDKTISDMQQKLEEANRKAIQGSQQSQGEILELDFEASLRHFFAQDTIEPVKTGARGGDTLQRVLGAIGRPQATIFWEIKRTQAWGGDWPTKAKEDAAEASAEIAIIVSEVLPKELKEFGHHDGIWATKPAFALMLAAALRQGLIRTAEAKQALIGKDTKMERLYSYMTGGEFVAILNGMVEPFLEMQKELNSEKNATQSRWKRQQRRLDRVIRKAAEFQGDLRGLVGSEMPVLPDFLDVEIEEEED